MKTKTDRQLRIRWREIYRETNRQTEKETKREKWTKFNFELFNV